MCPNICFLHLLQLHCWLNKRYFFFLHTLPNCWYLSRPLMKKSILSFFIHQWEYQMSSTRSNSSNVHIKSQWKKYVSHVKKKRKAYLWTCWPRQSKCSWLSWFTLQVTEISLVNTNLLYIKARIAQTSQNMQLEILTVLSTTIQRSESLQCVCLTKMKAETNKMKSEAALHLLSKHNQVARNEFPKLWTACTDYSMQKKDSLESA